jgi:hypothetical protein
MHDPIVIDPPGFDVAAAWEGCREARENVVDEDGEVNWGNAFGADPGCVSCPACRRYHWAWGGRQRCTACAFEYPTSWRSLLSDGSRDRGTLPLPPSPPKRPACPYYMRGWREPGLTFADGDRVDWRAAVAAFAPWEATPEEAASIAAALRGDCKHWRGTQDDRCAAGVHLRELAGGEDMGWCTRLPCLESFRNRPHGTPARCEDFALPTAEEVAAEEKADAEMMARMMKVLPLMGEIKRENREKSAGGVRPCPACGGRLHWNHAAYNGHVHLRCETAGCVHVLE